MLVEAIDPFSSNTFQAMHSYMAGDIAFDCAFAPTMSVNDDGRAQLSWERFHELLEVAFNQKQIVASSHS